MKSILKRIILISICLILIFSINVVSYGWSEIFSDGDDFIDQASNEYATISASSIQSLSSYLSKILLTAGILLSVVIGIILGIQFMIGGVEGQAKVKEMLVPYIVGMVIVFGAYGIWRLAIVIGNML